MGNMAKKIDQPRKNSFRAMEQLMMMMDGSAREYAMAE